ncbi:HNH endonuclease [Pseudofulvibacter geojedonensis]|uniref:HNH endonuclease n=1 Tax=Pseudofulvibacter geojedonensis TaxID=1123758 RepID=A0ABW3I0A7_9FLAO
MKKRVSIPKVSKVRAELQKEINSSCPFCESTDVGHFQIHHINENPSDNSLNNLLLLCPTCHSKITKGDILMNKVVEKKKTIHEQIQKLEFISISVDKKQCGWLPIQSNVIAFEANNLLKSHYPVFNLVFLNNSNKTQLLTGIKLSSKEMPVGMTGVAEPLPRALRPVIKYKIEIPKEGITNDIYLDEEIEIPAGRAFKFQVELYNEYNNQVYPPLGKYSLDFSFKFNNKFELKIPKIFLNCTKEYDTLPHYGYM